MIKFFFAGEIITYTSYFISDSRDSNNLATILNLYKDKIDRFKPSKQIIYETLKIAFNKDYIVNPKDDQFYFITVDEVRVEDVNY